MTDKSFEALLFAGSGFSFDDIVRTNVCGGKAAIIAYLECRRRIFVREMNTDPVDDPTAQGYLTVLTALDSALSLFVQFSFDSSNNVLEKHSNKSAA